METKKIGINAFMWHIFSIFSVIFCYPFDFFHPLNYKLRPVVEIVHIHTHTYAQTLYSTDEIMHRWLQSSMLDYKVYVRDCTGKEKN